MYIPWSHTSESTATVYFKSTNGKIHTFRYFIHKLQSVFRSLIGHSLAGVRDFRAVFILSGI